MGSTGKTIGSVGGAAVGTAIMPGVGTVLGGALGGALGGLFDSSDSPQAPQIQQVGYGGTIGPNGPAQVTKEADRVQQAGAASQQASSALGKAEQDAAIHGAQATQARDMGLGSNALARGQQQGGVSQLNAFQSQQDAALQQGRANGYQNQAIGTANQLGGMSADDRAQNQSALARLQGFYQQGPGPSAAEAQMRAGADQNMAQSIALARSGRGVGGNAAAMRQAQFQNAATGQQMNQQLGVLRANEAANWRQQQLGAMGMEQNTLGGMRAQDIGAQGQQLGFAGQMGNQGLGYGQLGQGYQQIGNQAQLGFEGMGTNAQLGYENMGNQANLGFFNAGNQARLGEQQLGQQANQFGETMKNNIFTQQGNMIQGGQIANANLQAGNAALQQKQDAANMSFLGSGLASAGALYKGGGNGGGNPSPGATGYFANGPVGPDGYTG